MVKYWSNKKNEKIISIFIGLNGIAKKYYQIKIICLSEKNNYIKKKKKKN